MKKVLLILSVIFVSFSLAYAHPPAKFNYQGVARDSSGKPLANQRITLKLTIIDVRTNLPDSVVYRETHTDTTNAFGLFNIEVGGGIIVSGTMAGINWAFGEKYMQVEMDPAGGTAYVLLGKSRLQSVPYSRRSEDAGMISMYGGSLAMGLNPNKMIIRHSMYAPTWGLQYDDANAQFNFLKAGMSFMDIDLGLKQLTLSGGLQLKSGIPGVDKVLTSDSTGMATWQDFATKASFFQPTGCQSLPAVTAVYQKIADMGTFTKNAAGTLVKLTLQTNVYATTLVGATGVIFELRVDSAATIIGNATALIRTAGTFDPITITGVFPALTSGPHTVSLWVKAINGTATDAGWDGDCFNNAGTNNVLVEEYK